MQALWRPRARHVLAVPQMAAAFDFAEDGETFTGLGLPPVDKYTQRAEASGALCRLGATHPEMSQGELCKKVQHQVGLDRVARVTTVFKALIAGYAAQGDKFVYVAGKNSITPGKTPGRGKRMEISPGFEKRCRAALRTAGNQRDAVAIFNEIALEEGRQPLGEQNTQSLRDDALMGGGPCMTV